MYLVKASYWHVLSHCSLKARPPSKQPRYILQHTPPWFRCLNRLEHGRQRLCLLVLKTHVVFLGIHHRPWFARKASDVRRGRQCAMIPDSDIFEHLLDSKICLHPVPQCCWMSEAQAVYDTFRKERATRGAPAPIKSAPTAS